MTSDAATHELLRRPEERRQGSVSTSSGVHPSPLVRPAELTDRQLLWIVSGVLFAVGVWPLALTEVPPYQDLPNHLATLRVIQHLDAYPEYVFNGFLKTNAALFTWLYVVSKVTGLNMAARLFAVVVLAANAIAIPRFVYEMSGRSRGRMLVASAFAWPMVHHWFVSMGMLDFSIAVPLSFGLLLALDRHRRTGSFRSALAVIGLGAATWYAHVFPLLVVHLLVLVDASRHPSWRQRWVAVRTVLLPLVPVTALALVSIGEHVRDTASPIAALMTHPKVLAPWELVYNLWAEWFWGFSNLSLTSIVPCVGLAVLGVWGVVQKRATPAFFPARTFVVLAVVYCFLPYKMTNWFHVNSRLVPFLWVGLMLYLPEALPRWMWRTLGAAAVLYSVGMGVDYVRLDRERQEFTAGMNAVPEGSRMLPLLFTHKSTATNTRNLMHMWGYYVVERGTSAPLLFAHSRSFPVTYSAPPPMRFHHLLLESFAPEMATPASVCRTAARWEACEELFASTWSRFYADATPRFDHLLVWDAPPEAVAAIPSAYEKTFAQGRLAIYARRSDGAVARAEP